MRSPHVRVRIDLSPACSVGPGKIALLEAIAETGSLSAAARSIGMSYRRGWLLLEELNSSFQTPLTHSIVGGVRGGGVVLTEFGRELVRTFRDFEQAVDSLGLERFGPFARAAKSAAARGSATRRRLNPSKRG